MPRNIVFLVYPGFDLLDLAGPLAVFADAEALAKGAYATSVVSAAGGQVLSSAGVAVATQAPDLGRSRDTTIIVGGAMTAVRTAPADLVDLVARHAVGARRVASVCIGAFLLQSAGLLDGRRATTHWKFAAELQAKAPETRLDPDKIFIRDGPVMTSAGATAGIDLALAMVEEDLGAEASKAVARGLVMYHRRPGGQSQFSALLEMTPPSDRIRRSLMFARDHLHQPLPVSRLAEAVALSERQFARAFRRETGTSPAKAVEKLRCEAARARIEDGLEPLETIARAVGFTDAELMRQAFVRTFGQPPSALRRPQAVG